jgi:tetratricopeptide (TPR) repeat protein
MSTVRKKSISLNHLETEFAATGKFRAGVPSSETRSLRSRYENADYRRSEAHALSGESDGLEALKSLISRGHLLEAIPAQARLVAESAGDPDLLLEIALQGCRLSVLEGDWKEAVSRCSRLESESELPGLSRLTLLQIRANALLELGDYARAAIDLKKAESIAQIFSHAPVSLYVQVLATKLLGRIDNFSFARARAASIWNEWKSKFPSHDLDAALTLVRLELDLARLSGRSHFEWAIASYLLATVIGDELYSALAWLDIAFASGNSAHPEIQTRLEYYSRIFPRIAHLRDELAGGNHLTDTAQGLNRARASEVQSSELMARVQQRGVDFEQIDRIVLLNAGILIDLKVKAASALPAFTPRSKLLIESVAGGLISKQEVFLRVWGIARFDKERHDATIRTAIRRLRKESGFTLESIDGGLRLDPRILVIT